MTDIAARIERSFHRFSDHVALCIEGKRYTYGELQQRTLAIQSIVDAAANQPLVGIATDDSLDTYASVLAVLRAGRAFVPINPQHPLQRNERILTEAGVSTLLVPNSDLSGQPLNFPGISAVLTRDVSPSASSDIPVRRPGELAYLLFTSGSTGEPKGVPITRGNLSAFLDSLDDCRHGVTAADRVLQMFELNFDFSIASYLAPLCKGAGVYTLPSNYTKFAEAYRLLADERLTVAPLVPSLLTYLRPYFADIHLPSLRQTVLCGEALFADIANEWARCAPAGRIANFYGPTEATVFAMVYDWLPGGGRDKSLNGIVSIGKPMPGNRALVVDPDLHLVAPGEKGELCLSGPQVSPGYWRDPIRNANAFFENDAQRFYRTGDIVIPDSDGDHYFCGRIGTQVKLQGFRVELGEIEHHARSVAPGCECIVIPFLDKSGGTELNLVVENFQGDLKALLASLRSRIPAYMVPKRAISIEKLPINSNGKIDRAALTRQVDAIDG